MFPLRWEGNEMKPKILVVEDEDQLSEIYRIALEQKGYLVDSCRNGSEALFKMGRNNYDMIITDYLMPNINGTAIMDAINSGHYQRPDCPILFITGFSEDISKEVDLFRKKGLNVSLIRKPYPVKDLAAKVSAIISQK